MKLKMIKVICFSILIMSIGCADKSTKETKTVIEKKGKTAEETRNFADLLQNKLGIKVYFQDETLTTKDAQEMSISAGIGRKRRRRLEDAYSAALILQQYLDENY